MNAKMWDVVVVGAGASGLMAAYRAAKSGAEVLLLEKEKRPGRKLFATGNGRCNLSHRGFSLKNFHSQQAHFPAQVLARLPEKATLALWEALGVSVVADERARYYPRSLQAGAVVDVLRFSCEEAGVALQTEVTVQSLSQKDAVFYLTTGQETITARSVVVACGGAAGAPLGGTEAGYQLLQAFGHDVVPIMPGIVQLKTHPAGVRGLRGQKWEAQVQLVINDTVQAKDEGEVLFTEYGLSGPPILQLSGQAVRALAKKQSVHIHLDLLPALSVDALGQLLLQRKANHPTRSREQLFIGVLPRILATVHLVLAGYQPLDAPAATLSDKHWQKLAVQLKNWVLPITGSQDLKAAQVTLGGVATTDFDPETLGSWLAPGLYACGEVLDVDGDCGGYNLQWAWSSGYVAGTEAAAFARLMAT